MLAEAVEDLARAHELPDELWVLAGEQLDALDGDAQRVAHGERRHVGCGVARADGECHGGLQHVEEAGEEHALELREIQALRVGEELLLGREVGDQLDVQREDGGDLLEVHGTAGALLGLGEEGVDDGVEDVEAAVLHAPHHEASFLSSSFHLIIIYIILMVMVIGIIVWMMFYR